MEVVPRVEPDEVGFVDEEEEEEEGDPGRRSDSVWVKALSSACFCFRSSMFLLCIARRFFKTSICDRFLVGCCGAADAASDLASSALQVLVDEKGRVWRICSRRHDLHIEESALRPERAALVADMLPCQRRVATVRTFERDVEVR